MLAALILLPGCQKQPAPASVTPPAPAEAKPQAVAPLPKTADREIWEVFYLQGAKIGYGQTSIAPVQVNGRPLLAIKSLNELSITRFGQQSKQQIRMECRETPEGQLVDFRTDLALGPAAVVVTGQVDNGTLTLTTASGGQQQVAKLPLPAEVLGFRGVEESLERAPLAEGETRRLKVFMPVINQVADVTLKAQQLENTPVLGVEARLLRIDNVARLPDGQEIATTLWTDPAGQVVKTRVAALDQESFAATREIALAPSTGPAKLDLGLDLIVKIDPPIANAHESKQLNYEVTLIDGDPTKTFAQSATQQVRSIGPHQAEIIVRSLRPGDVPAAKTKPAAVDPQYSQANSVLQIDDPRIQAMAREARGEAKDPRQIALALERYVHHLVSKKNFSQGFATAAEVAETREGDCTEHAVLLAALARACGIPSRVAIGLVYVGAAGGFGYHMWTEVYLEGQWVALDATLGQGGTSAAYLKLNDTSLAGASAYSSFLSVANVLGRLKVRVRD